MKEPKVVIDSNVLVSALKGKTTHALLYTAFKESRFKLVISTEIIKELAAVLYRPHLKINPRDIKELFRLIKANSIRINLPPPFITACRDPKDNFILELAVKAEADFIVTGDKDLLVLNPFKGISIVTLNEFISCLNK
jgi:putative PIN family toxin of toxin-antitoxin system